MESKYASSQRLPIEEIMMSKDSLDRSPYIYEIFCSLSYIFCILNEHRQIVFVNDVMMKNLGIEKIDEVLGKRFGEAFECVHAKDEKGGCGTSEHCRYCGAVNAMLQSKVDEQKTMKECRIRRQVMGKEFSLELEVTATPFTHENSSYTIFSLIDITDKKRKAMIERIFFHDILNTAGALSNIFEILDVVDEQEKVELMAIASSLSQQILDEITTQRLLMQAETASLIVKDQRINTFEFLEILDKDLKYHEVARGKVILPDQSSDHLFFVSDPVILRKILNNMIKNALEASHHGDTVVVKAKKTEDKLRFSVHNKAFMPAEVEMQVFMRSFSTKGMQRGLGTYSMKVLGEQYLGGKVSFTTDTVQGTTFFIDLDHSETD